MKSRVTGIASMAAVVLAVVGLAIGSTFARATNQDIVDTAVGAGQFKTLAAALQAAGLVDTLKGGKHGRAWDRWVEEKDPAFALKRGDWLARRFGDLGDLYLDAKKPPEARASLTMEVTQRFNLIASDEAKAKERQHDNDAAKRSFAWALRRLGAVEFRRGDKTNAIAFYRDCVETMSSLARQWQQVSSANDELLGRCQMGRGNALRRLGLDQLTDGRATFTDAATAYEAALSAFEQAAQRKGDERSFIRDARYGLAVSLILRGQPKEEAEVAWTTYLGLARDTLGSAREGYAKTKNESTSRDLVDALGSASMDALINRDPSSAARYAEEAAALGSAPQAWIEINRAHAYLLLGRVDEAQAIYRRYLKEDPVYVEDVKEDFRVLRQRGIALASMDTIEREFGIRQ